MDNHEIEQENGVQVDVFAEPLPPFNRYAPPPDAYSEVPPPIHFEPRTSLLPTMEEAYASMVHNYSQYVEAVSRVALDEDKLLSEKAELETARANIIATADPKTLGANEEQRKAQVAIMTTHLSAPLALREKTMVLLKCEVEIARLRCRLCDQTLRFIEVATLQKEDTDHG